MERFSPDEIRFQKTGIPSSSGGYRNNIVHTMSNDEYRELGQKKRKSAQKCLDCGYNKEGFCKRYKKWASVARPRCVDSCKKKESSSKTKRSKPAYNKKVPQAHSTRAKSYFEQIYGVRNFSTIEDSWAKNNNQYYVIIYSEKRDEEYICNIVMQFNSYIKKVKYRLPVEKSENLYAQCILNLIPFFTKKRCKVYIVANKLNDTMLINEADREKIEHDGEKNYRFYKVEFFGDYASENIENAYKHTINNPELVSI